MFTENAKLAMAGHKGTRHAQKGVLPPLEKEKMPPKKFKKTVSVASLFEQQHDLRRKAKEDAHDILGPKAAGVYKQYAVSRKSEHNPLFRRFQGQMR